MTLKLEGYSTNGALTHGVRVADDKNVIRKEVCYQICTPVELGIRF